MINRKNPLIFLVDDNLLFRKTVDAFLKQHRLMKVKHFSSGEEMLEALNHSTPQIIIQDIDLGINRMSGLEILKKVKGRKPKIDFIILSGHNNVQIAIEVIKSGAFDYVVKDETANEVLLNRIKRLIFQEKLVFTQRIINWAAVIVLGLIVVAVCVGYFLGYHIAIEK